MNAETGDGPPRAELAPLIQAEQVRLSVEQVRRIPLPHFFVDLCVAWTGWHAGLGMLAWGWLVLMTACQVGRTIYVVRLDRQGTLSAPQMLARLANLLAFLGAMHALFMALVFTRPLGDSHYILTMIMVGNAAGAVSPAAGHLRSYVSWGVVFGGTLAVCWVTRGTLEGAAIALLLLFLFTILTLYVRDQGRTLVKLVSLSDSLRRERDRAERASEAKTRFFAAASHDLRQPLTALSYHAATVQALALGSGDETLTRVGDGIRRALAESRGLLDSLLEVSELDAGAVEVSCDTVDVTTLLAEVCESFAPLAQERGLRLRALAVPGSPLLAHTDVALLRRIVQNLVGNAIKFTPDGSVTLEARADMESNPGSIHVRVSDTGPGIPPEAQERVFEEFYQVGNVERNRSRGLGLGLAIVRRLAALLDARVTLNSTPGEGAVFEIVVPRSPVAAAPAEIPLRSGTPAPRSFARRRILLVDDERDIRDSLTTFLTTLGWEASAAAGQEEALQACEAGFAPDAIIVDFRLREGASGLDALAALRRQGCMAPAWLITGDTEPKRIAAARAAGLPVVYKPVDGLQLAALIDGALAKEAEKVS